MKARTTYTPIRKIGSGEHCTVVGTGPVILNALAALAELEMCADVFVISEIPVPSWNPELKASLDKNRRLVIVEEHVKRGGLGEYLAEWILSEGPPVKYVHCHAHGYPDGRYGSQAYHQQSSQLDVLSLKQVIKEITDV